ncbi:hypothetical protein K458DRAFT_386644 [Lentithecium fluviatile CBS 122367]|uniref:NACHT domain-containing protein n=1 Tax=Lentithecium fluviatile CBS 122367 TaxID=1168545 RepID=A0A6G1J831_9PLEO|nr:hypothetical protein K458DRAFT_386644 [Lentithecium fluviatile CBS 122367]
MLGCGDTGRALDAGGRRRHQQPRFKPVPRSDAVTTSFPWLSSGFASARESDPVNLFPKVSIKPQPKSLPSAFLHHSSDNETRKTANGICCIFRVFESPLFTPADHRSMESIAALGLAANIVQFVHFGATLLSEASERHHSASGATIGNAELELIANNLQQLTADLTVSRPGSDSQVLESGLQDICKRCRSVADELIAVLDDLRVKGEHKRWESFKQAAKSIRKEKKIEDLKKRLDDLQHGIMVCLMAVMRGQQSEINATLEQLLDYHCKMEISGATNLRDLRLHFIEALETAHRNWLRDSTRVVTGFRDELVKLVKSNEEAATTQAVILSLKYELMTARQRSIEDAHRKTFEWIFHDTPNEPCAKSSFLDWMKSGDGIYWIAGRAGSGKSTLVKYLFEHPKTRGNLKIWASGKKVIMASHFFWIAGTKMQKSQEGLLSSLLDTIFTQIPALIPAVAPWRWQKAKTQTLDREPWTRKELIQALGLLRKQRQIPVRFCFFVDGLDEYDGDHDEIVRVLQDLITSPDIKVCASSRPWNVFEKTLGKRNSGQLCLEDLTREDIRLYVHETLAMDPRFLDLDDEHEAISKQQITEAIVDLAHGVFLWVILVVRDLLRGLSNDDTVSVLQKRLYSLPSTLEGYFQLMLDRIDAVYREQTAQILFLVLEAERPLPLMMLAFLDKFQTGYAIESPIQAKNQWELYNLCNKTRTRVKARCCDLLEVAQPGSNFFVDPQVVLLHRTVRDFLLTAHAQKQLRHHLPTFDTRAYCYEALLLQMKMLPPSPEYVSSTCIEVLMLNDLMFYAYSIERSGTPFDLAALDEAERILKHRDTASSESDQMETLTSLREWPHASPSTLQPIVVRFFASPPGERVYQAALEFGFHRYVDKRRRDEPGLDKGFNFLIQWFPAI